MLRAHRKLNREKRSGPEVLVLYLKRPTSSELGVEALAEGASDTAT